MNNRTLAIAIILLAVMALPAEDSPAQVVINEILQNPEFVGDTEGEWVELHNIGPEEIDINGWTIRDDGSNNHVIDHGSPLIIPSCGFLVVGKTTDTLLNGNVTVTYAYGGDFTLGNGVDQVVIEDGDGEEVDRVAYDDGLTFPDPSGASMELRHPSLNNSHGANWAEAVVPWSTNDLGTPGFANSVLDTVPPRLVSIEIPNTSQIDVIFNEPVERNSAETPGNYSVSPNIGAPLLASRDASDSSMVHLTVPTLSAGVSYQLNATAIKDIPGNESEADSLSFILPVEPQEGDIIITEIMKDPAATGDSDGEWFEVYNSTPLAIDLGGWIVTDRGSNSFTVGGSFLIPSESFGVFTVNTDSSTNGGFHTERVYDWGSSSTFTLGNTDDKIVILAGNTLIDSISYDGGTFWPDTTGGSIGLSDFSLENNDGGNWSIAPAREPGYSNGLGDYGSPGTLGLNQSRGVTGFIQTVPDQLNFVTGRDESYSLELSIENMTDNDITWQVLDSDDSGDCAWISEDPAGGTIPAGKSFVLAVAANATGLSPQTYSCTLHLSTSNPDFPLILIPVSLEVVDTSLSGGVTIPSAYLPIPAGGDTVPIDFSLFNHTGLQRSADMWISLRIPGTEIERPVLGPRDPGIPPFGVLTKSRFLKIPADGPPGTYVLSLSLGVYPDSVSFQQKFPFEKLSPAVRTRDAAVQPQTTSLGESYPNPFNSSTTMKYSLAEETWVTIRVYNLLGEVVATITDEFQGAGYHTFRWEGRNQNGTVVGSGIYLVVLRTPSMTQAKTLTLLR